MAPSPRGIEIGNGGSKKRIWKVGKELGRGACATVCALNNDDGSSTEFAIKLAPVAEKKTKKANSIQERNEALLHYEQLIYQTQFQDLQGKIIPSLPTAAKEPPIAGEASGYKFFIMEKMESTISSMIPQLLQIKPSAKQISFGPAAVRLLTCVKAIHDRNNVIRDVKTENFMLARGAGTGSSLEEKLASRIRLIDLALATQWTSAYRETNEAESLVGTPLYASLNVHAGTKSSYRDDLESLGYVIAELLSQLYAGDTSKQLPWFQGKSDDDIAAIKKAQVDNPNSDFYHQLGNGKTIAVFSEYMNAVRTCTFKKKPDYDELSSILSKLTIPRTKTAPKAATTKKTTSGAAAAMAPKTADTSSSVSSKRTTRSSAATSAFSSGPPRKVARQDKSMDISFESGIDSIYSDARQEMDWEYTVDENEEPLEDSKPAAKVDTPRRIERVVVNERSDRRRKNAPREVEPEIVVICDDDDNQPDLQLKRLQRRGLRIEVIGGPHKGESFELEAGSSGTLILGSNPSSKVGTIIALKKDKSLDATHVRLDLNTTKGNLTTLTVTDKSKKGTTYVNRDAVRSTKGFIDDTIKIGNTSLKIKSL